MLKRIIAEGGTESAWIGTEAEHLRIADDRLWLALDARQAQISPIFGPNPVNTIEGRTRRAHQAHRNPPRQVGRELPGSPVSSRSRLPPGALSLAPTYMNQFLPDLGIRRVPRKYTPL